MTNLTRKTKPELNNQPTQKFGYFPFGVIYVKILESVTTKLYSVFMS